MRLLWVDSYKILAEFYTISDIPKLDKKLKKIAAFRFMQSHIFKRFPGVKTHLLIMFWHCCYCICMSCEFCGIVLCSSIEEFRLWDFNGKSRTLTELRLWFLVFFFLSLVAITLNHTAVAQTVLLRYAIFGSEIEIGLKITDSNHSLYHWNSAFSSYFLISLWFLTADKSWLTLIHMSGSDSRLRFLLSVTGLSVVKCLCIAEFCVHQVQAHIIQLDSYMPSQWHVFEQLTKNK